MKLFAEFQDTTLAESFREGNNFTEEISKAIESKLTAEEKKFTLAAMEMFRNQRDVINPVFSKMNGINMASNPKTRPGLEDMILTLIKGSGVSVGNAILRIERAYNPNMMED